MTKPLTALVIGSGPAGLMAADQLSAQGLNVTLVEAKPSPARKFLMAGKSGLNLTKAEDKETFLNAYAEATTALRPMIKAFGQEDVQDWARSLGQDVFAGSSGRVFPKTMKASPLLRNWLSKLEARGVELKRRWRWTGLGDEAKSCIFETREGQQSIAADVVVLALGGASWARLGSDGNWTKLLEAHGVAIKPFQPANMGLKVAWSDYMQSEFGKPVKAVKLQAGKATVRGEFVLSAKGLEGSAIYALSRPLREGAPLTADLAPDLSNETIAERLTKARKGATLSEKLRKAVRLDSTKRALLMEFARPLPTNEVELAQIIKALHIEHDGPRPMDEAISTAGGIVWSAVDEHLMLRELPGIFCAGEMLDWEAPTGGYLITACLATGRCAGLAAAEWAKAQK